MWSYQDRWGQDQDRDQILQQDENTLYICGLVRSETRLCFVTYHVCYIFKWCSCSPLANSQIIYHTVRWWHFIDSPFHWWTTKALSCVWNRTHWLDMSINEKKSYCIRIGPRSDLKRASITTSIGHNLPWVNEVQYLGTYIISHRHFKCSVTQAKSPFIVPLMPYLEMSVE